MSNELNISEILNSKVFKPPKIDPNVEKKRQISLLVSIVATINAVSRSPSNELQREIIANYYSFNACKQKVSTILTACKLAREHDINIYQAVGILIDKKQLDQKIDFKLIPLFIEIHGNMSYHKALSYLEEDLLKFENKLVQMDIMKDLYPNEYLTNLQKAQKLLNFSEVRAIIIDNNLPFYAPDRANSMRGISTLPREIQP